MIGRSALMIPTSRNLSTLNRGGGLQRFDAELVERAQRFEIFEDKARNTGNDQVEALADVGRVLMSLFPDPIFAPGGLTKRAEDDE
jgi:hypothetical protein